MRLPTMVKGVLLLPALAWLAIGSNDLFRNGLYSYSSLFPFPFKMHTLSLLNIGMFYLTTFLVVTPHKPVKNFLITCSLLFLFNAVYEFAFAVFYDWKGLIVTFPLVLGGLALVLLLNRRYSFLTSDRRKISLAMICFSCFFLLMLTLNQSGFFEQVRLYLSGQTATDPHNLLWIVSKMVCLWTLFPLLKISRFGLHG